MSDACEFPPGLSVRNDLRPGDLGIIVARHGVIYSLERSWDCAFEAYVSEALGAFAARTSPRERIWIVEKDGRFVGSVAIVEGSLEEAQLRWLFLEPEWRGIGIGRALMAAAVGFAKASGYAHLFLWTEASLDRAATLYRSFGFVLTESVPVERWGTHVVEQRYDLPLSGDNSA